MVEPWYYSIYTLLLTVLLFILFIIIQFNFGIKPTAIVSRSFLPRPQETLNLDLRQIDEPKKSEIKSIKVKSQENITRKENILFKKCFNINHKLYLSRDSDHIISRTLVKHILTIHQVSTKLPV